MNKQIDPGEGWRLLGDNELIKPGDEFRSGDVWIQTEHTPEQGRTPSGNCNAYRRRITDDGWVKTSERLPTKEDANAENLVMGYYVGYTKGPVHTITDFNYITPEGWSHWCKLKPPIPEQSEEDKAFDAFASKASTNSIISGRDLFKAAWDARGEWEKTRVKK